MTAPVVHPMAQQVDWSELVLRVKRRGAYTDGRLAETVGSDWRHIGHLRRAEVEQPRFRQGVRLLALADRHLTDEDWRRVLPRR